MFLRILIILKRSVVIMPKNQFQRMVFAFLTVLVTVHAYIFYSLYVVNGATILPCLSVGDPDGKSLFL